MSDNDEATTPEKIKATEVQPPPKNPHNIEATKYYVFNQTGNIMMSSTVDSNTPIAEEVQKIFAEVSVFFAGMSRAMSTTMNPATGKPYSLYNYAALESVIKGSGLFVHVTEEDVTHTSKSGGATFSKDLIESLLGLATGTGALAFASSMISSIGKEGLTISARHDHTDSKVCNIVFVCEYLLGMPSISAIVVYADMTKNETAFQVGPCIKGHSESITLDMHKDTYMFVTPTFIHEYAGDLDSINSDPKYLEMISWLSGLLLRTPEIFNVADKGDGYKTVESGQSLKTNHPYVLQGQFLPVPVDGSLEVKLEWANTDATATFGADPDFTNDQITFTVSSAMDTESAIKVVVTKDTVTKTVAISNGSYKVVAAT
ncbi:hypothetical protein [Lacimicrobium alkaliphilum]|uniref:Uncharacterized protein n=1 Tax=Lacimicrobium alkaliphilum TaxID=1526571 RepID=A0ABQ1RL39_9ALTE|nr:hypothetical protein [Lacimicrobium alkaliphilum]GGD73487.1 hypothetical protein GCM10011357_30730 [Lacimicrobium alkaliphilum]